MHEDEALVVRLPFAQRHEVRTHGEEEEAGVEMHRKLLRLLLALVPFDSSCF